MSQVETLTDDERELFEHLSEKFDDEPEGRIFDLVLQSDAKLREESSS